MRVLLDTQIWIYLHPKPGTTMSAAQKELHVRARILEGDLEEEEAEIVVPTLIVGEYLTGCEPSTWTKVVQTFAETFVCPDYDLPATQQAARVHMEYVKQLKGKIYKDRRNVLSSDIKILGTALAQRVKRIYTHDAEFRRLASLFLEAFDLPTKSNNLFREADIRQSLS